MSDPTDSEKAPVPPAHGVLGAALGAAAQRAGLDPSTPSPTGAMVWRAMGGVRGMAESVLPTLVFIVVWTVTVDPTTGRGDLLWAVGLSVGLAVLFTVVRLVRRSPAAPALGGLVATAAAAALALWTGRASDNFVLGIITNAVYGGVLLISALVRRPLIGVAVGWLMGDPEWRMKPRRRRTLWWLTIAWALLFGARLAVELPLFLADDVTALGIAKIAMGLPLFAPLVAVTWLAVRALYRTADEVDATSAS